MEIQSWREGENDGVDKMGWIFRSAVRYKKRTRGQFGNAIGLNYYYYYIKKNIRLRLTDGD